MKYKFHHADCLDWLRTQPAGSIDLVLGSPPNEDARTNSIGYTLKGKYTLIAEGARGSLTKELVAKFRLEQGRQPQKYGLGLKERVDAGFQAYAAIPR